LLTLTFILVGALSSGMTAPGVFFMVCLGLFTASDKGRLS
jgi:hypothetical protein